MEETRGRILVVDDDFVNRTLLATSLEEEGYMVETAENGRQALDQLRHGSFDVLLLDILMPEVDGYEVLAEVKRDKNLARLPVIVISAVDEIESVIRCIEVGATDYLPKPFEPSLLRARLNASLVTKRLRDLELEYLEQVGYVIAAAGRVEAGTFDVSSLDAVAARSDTLGQLARVFQKMAREVYAREERLRQQIKELRIEIDEVKQAKQVSEITESEYFKSLRSQADDLRQIIEGTGE